MERLVQIEWPKSPCEAFQTHLAYWTGIGWSRPISCLSVLVSLAYLKFSTMIWVTSPGTMRMSEKITILTMISVGIMSRMRWSTYFLISQLAGPAESHRWEALWAR